ncbi:hypothetical protein R1flu_007618 [Riccia fluitans]|uniref:CENP-C n=1 Tax=Riccia fluitans TaxID=41844 RepID=A0ABD1YZD6_9MARC
MFRLKVSSLLSKINEVKVCIGLSSPSSSSSLSVDDSGKKRNAAVATALDEEASSRGGKRRVALDNPVAKSGTAVKANEVYTLEMNEKRSRLSFIWALNVKKKTTKPSKSKNSRSLPGPPRKRGRANHLSSSSANCKPPWNRHRGGQQLKLIDDPFHELAGTPQQQQQTSEPELQWLQRVSRNDERFHRVNENEDKRFDSTLKPETSHKSGSRETVSSEKNQIEKKDAHSSLKEETRKSHSGTKRDPHSKAQKSIMIDPVLLHEKQPKQEPFESGLARENSQEVTPQKRRKRQAETSENHETPGFEPAISKSVKAEVNIQEARGLKCQAEAVKHDDGEPPEYTGLAVVATTSHAIEKPNTTNKPDVDRGKPDDDGTDQPSRLINLLQEALFVDDGQAEIEQSNGQRAASASQAEAHAQTSLADATDVQATKLPPENLCVVNYAYHEEKEKVLVEEEITYGDEYDEKTDAPPSRSQSPEWNAIVDSNSVEKIQDAFMDFLKRHCKHKQEDGELFVILNAS